MPTDSDIRLTVNGEERSSRAQTLGELLCELSLDGVPLIAEVNAAIIGREQINDTPLTSGDRIELVRFVGGG